MNRLADETSPYLRQHADNPVDWYPWGDDAFDDARRSDRPVLLSVGYSACHWCHVMAHESFEDAETARLMNELFVNVKVDREERPDVDAIYMDAVTAMTGHGGWPMTVFLTPDGRPFWGGTYFPPEARRGMPAFGDVLRQVRAAWDDRREDLLGQADTLTASIGRTARISPSDATPGPEVLETAVTHLRSQYDAAWGGFGRAPKFPQTMSLETLLRWWRRTGDDDVASIVVNSLDCMASGGVYDHLGGGFARYSVDRTWTVPHFEKMLYDNALLTSVYLHGYQATGRERFAQVVTETVGYVMRDLRHDRGGFFSAEDADSEGVEGKFYVWTPDEIREVLGDDADEAMEWYGVTPEGNFEGSSILVRPLRGDLIRPDHVESARRRLFEARERRVRPGLDDKVLTEWNALMLSALAEAAVTLRRDDWLHAAVETADFLVTSLRGDDGRWLRSWQDDGGGGRARHLAYAQDHAALVDAFVRLAEATGRARWITHARETADALLDLFWDPDVGGVFTTGHDAQSLVTRPKDVSDNATPSANSATAVALARLGALTGESRYTAAAEAVLRLLGGLAAEHPTAFGHLLGAVDLLHHGTVEVVVAGDRPDLVDVVATAYTPNVVLAWGERWDSPLWEGRSDGRAYLCRGFVCQAPTDDPGVLADQLAAS